MSITPSPVNSVNSINSLELELKQQYQGLTDEVKAYFDKQEAEFVAQSKSSYQNPDSFAQDRAKFLIKKKIDDLDTHRREIWTYLTAEFNRNTYDKSLNAKMMSQNKNDTARNQKTYQKYLDKLEDAKGNTDTTKRLREIELYELNRRKDQVFLMKIISLTLLVCLFLSFGILNEVLPMETVFVVILIFGGLIGYVIYYVYIKNSDRSRRNWDKYYFEQPTDTIKKDSNVIEDINYDKLDKDLDGEFHKYIDACATKKSPETKIDTTKLTPST
jgi:hypothetical protein|uniref:Uncharacterized protein n=1 Tax=viral metagenome TaxID=1070528 RepID=A0A6C0ECC9_9ZZZZ